MTIRALASALALSALTPLAAHADAPAGDFHTLFAAAPTAIAAPDSRAQHRNYVEFALDELVRETSHAMVSAEQVRRAVAIMPLPAIDA